MHALIVENEPLIALAIEDALRGCGFTSFAFAASADEAATAAALKCPDLITAAVELRPGCGIATVQSICSEQRAPVLFITASPGEVSIRMPGHPVVEKPFSADQIVNAVKRLSQFRSQKRQ